MKRAQTQNQVNSPLSSALVAHSLSLSACNLKFMAEPGNSLQLYRKFYCPLARSLITWLLLAD